MNRYSWARYQKLSLALPSLPLTVDLSRTSLSDEALESDPLLLDAFPRAFEEMDALEKGAIANPDENRQVGHYWLRNPSLAPNRDLETAIGEARDKVISFAAAVHSGEIAPEKESRFENFLLIGIGGSALGPQFVADALTSAADKMTPFFFDNTDPDGMERELGRIEKAGGLGRTLTLVISKSGGTKETRNGMLEAAAAYREKGLSFARHAVAVTQDGSQLDRIAREEGWLERFPMWDWVGGRTSVLSAVGLLPAALQGIGVLELLEGAACCDALTRSHAIEKNPAALLALTWFRETGGRGARDMVVLPYKDRLLLFSRYLQQLVMESLGKEKDLRGCVVNQGISVYGNKGSTDQHAFVQQLRDGVPNFFVTFIEVLEDCGGGRLSIEVEPGVHSGDYLQGFFLGTRQALSEKGRPSMTLTIRDVTPRSIGILIALYERAVGFYASLVGINAYHQPGVEAGKKAAGEILALQLEVARDLEKNRGTFRTAEEIAVSAGVPGKEEVVFKILEHLSATSARGFAKKPADPVFQSKYGCAE